MYSTDSQSLNRTVCLSKYQAACRLFMALDCRDQIGGGWRGVGVEGVGVTFTCSSLPNLLGVPNREIGSTEKKIKSF